MSFRECYDDPFRPRFVSKYIRCDPCLDEIRRKKEEARIQADDHPRNPYFLDRYRQHRERIECIGSKVDSSPPHRGFSLYAETCKYNQRLKDFNKIQDENVKFLKNISLVLSGANRKPFSRSEIKLKRNKAAQDRELVETEIAFQNITLFRRINDAKPKYPTCDFLKWYRKEEDRMEKMSQYPLFWKSKCDQPDPNKIDDIVYYPEKVKTEVIYKGPLLKKHKVRTWPYSPEKKPKPVEEPIEEPQPPPRPKKPPVPRAPYYHVPKRVEYLYGFEPEHIKRKWELEEEELARKKYGSNAVAKASKRSDDDESEEFIPLTKAEMEDIILMTKPPEDEQNPKFESGGSKPGPVITGQNLAITNQNPGIKSPVKKPPSKTSSEIEKEQKEAEEKEAEKNEELRKAEEEKEKALIPKSRKEKFTREHADKRKKFENKYNTRHRAMPLYQTNKAKAQALRNQRMRLSEDAEQSLVPSNNQRRKSTIPKKSDGNDKKVDETSTKPAENKKVDDSKPKRPSSKPKGSVGKKSRASENWKKSLKKSTGKVGANSIDGQKSALRAPSYQVEKSKTEKDSKSSKKSSTKKSGTLKKGSSTINDPDTKSALRASYSQAEKEKLQKESEEKMKNKKASSTSQNKSKMDSKSGVKPESKTDNDAEKSGFEFANSDIMKSNNSAKIVPSKVPEPQESLGVESTMVEEHRADDPEGMKIVSSHQGKRFAASESDTQKESAPSNDDKTLAKDPKSKAFQLTLPEKDSKSD